MQTAKTVVFWLLIMASAFVLWQVVRTGGTTPHTPEISYSRFVSQVADGQISKVTITCNLVQGYDIKGGSFLVVAPPNQAAMLETLQQHGVEIWFRDSTNWPNWVLYLVPLILLVVLWIVMMRAKFGELADSSRPPKGSPVLFPLDEPSPVSECDFCHFRRVPRFPPKRSRIGARRFVKAEFLPAASNV